MKALVAFALLCLPPASGLADEVPKVAGTEVPVPKRTKTVQPDYPAEALAQGLRGIVILDLLIDTQGHVSAVEVLRSVPPFDAASVAAVRKWEYEVTRVDGKPVSVRLTVPITFALKLPEISSRQDGIPELRQGAVPTFPPGAPPREGGSVTARVTLEPDGRIAELSLVSGLAPFADALLQPLRSWRFAPPGEGAVVSFRVEAEFVPAGKNGAARIDVRLAGLQRSESVLRTEPEPQATATPSPTPTGPAAAAPEPASAAQPAAPPTAASPRPPAPATEVVALPAPDGAAPAAGGVSAVQDVAISAGAPDLVRGRRPIVAPLARMGNASGTVVVRFAVDAAGAALVQSVEGPELLKAGAEQAVATWVFRRMTADRLHLVAVFSYEGNAASATVGPQEQP